MRAIILSAVAAVALSGCTLVTPAIDQATDTTLEQRCETYRVELDNARLLATIVGAGSPKAAAIAFTIARLEEAIATYCTIRVVRDGAIEE